MRDGDAGGRLLDAGGVRLHVVEQGSGSPVLVLHGFGGSGAAMAPLVAKLAALATRHRVIAPDLPGHGASAAPHDPAAYGWDAIVRQMLALLDALDVERAHLLGFSLGGRIALQLAARAPARVRSVVTVGARCAWPDAREREARRHTDAALAARLETDGALALTAVLRALGAADQPEVDTAALAASGVPLRLLAGEHDPGPLAAARALARDLPGAEVLALPGAGHRAHLERAGEVARLALELFARAEADARDAPNDPRRTRRAAAGEGEGRW